MNKRSSLVSCYLVEMGRSSKTKTKVDPNAWVKEIVAEFFKPIVDESETTAPSEEAHNGAAAKSEEPVNRCEQAACKRKMTHGCLRKYVF